ncbi:allograft inflammatory factor 1-like isoform X2 [Eublepharis macularius]|uniref:Allograft inflammatory factor 1-like isoform X2 n=1 Tax=Eublepharis macularius TaxID=481883 RepID=A0AA97KF17_EUBMA|nr:allograft inflammatory factor 1-like isoform X2 [Eublepharis macularius]
MKRIWRKSLQFLKSHNNNPVRWVRFRVACGPISSKEKYMEFDLNNQGEIDLMSVKRMMEKLGAPKTHLELKKMISEVTGGVSDTISYQDFVNVMLGKRSAVLKLVMMFEGKANESIPKPSGPPPERDIASLP